MSRPPGRSDPVGTALATGQSLLLTLHEQRNTARPFPRPGFFLADPSTIHRILTQTASNP
jgi:hypothetical protein